MPASIAMMRMAGGALFFHVLAWLLDLRRFHVRLSDHAKLFGLSILGISANQTLFLLGLRWTTPFAVSLLGATIPIFTAGLAVVFGRERLVARTVIGLGLALGGVLSLTGIGALDVGALFVAMNSLGYAAYIVLGRNVLLRVGPIRSMVWLFTYGALSFTPIGVPALSSQIGAITMRGWMYVAWIVAVPTIVAYSLNAWALARSSATLVTTYIYLQPLLAGLLAWVQLGHRISSRAWLAAVLILVGLGVVASRGPTKAR